MSIGSNLSSYVNGAPLRRGANRKRCKPLSIIAIESAYDLAIMFGDKELAAIYTEALVEAGVHYESKATCWAD